MVYIRLFKLANMVTSHKEFTRNNSMVSKYWALKKALNHTPDTEVFLTLLRIEGELRLRAASFESRFDLLKLNRWSPTCIKSTQESDLVHDVLSGTEFGARKLNSTLNSLRITIKMIDNHSHIYRCTPLPGPWPSFQNEVNFLGKRNWKDCTNL